jgi:hypothetical protein
MAPYMATLSQQPEYKGVSFVRVDIEACPVRVRQRSHARPRRRSRLGARPLLGRAAAARHGADAVLAPLARARAQALGAKMQVLAAPTYHFYREGAQPRTDNAATPQPWPAHSATAPPRPLAADSPAPFPPLLPWRRARAGTLLDSSSGALPAKLMELLAKHKGAGSKPRANWLLVALLGGVAAACLLAVSAALKDAPAAPVAAGAPPAAARPGDAEAAAPEEQESEPLLRAPAKKSAGGPSKGARQA